MCLKCFLIECRWEGAITLQQLVHHPWQQSDSPVQLVGCRAACSIAFVWTGMLCSHSGGLGWAAREWLINKLPCCIRLGMDVYYTICLPVHVDQQPHSSRAVLDDGSSLLLSCADVAAPHCSAHRSGSTPTTHTHVQSFQQRYSEKPTWRIHFLGNVVSRILSDTSWPRQYRTHVCEFASLPFTLI